MRRAFFRVSSTFLGVALAAAAGLGGGTALAAKSARHMTRIKGSYLPTTATQTGSLSASRMSVDMVLQPSDEAGLNSLLQSQYTPGSADYGHGSQQIIQLPVRAFALPPCRRSPRISRERA